LVKRLLVGKFKLIVKKEKDYSEGISSDYKAAVHYVFEIPAKLIQRSNSLLYELQIRTEMQHTWTEKDHEWYVRYEERYEERYASYE